MIECEGLNRISKTESELRLEGPILFEKPTRIYMRLTNNRKTSGLIWNLGSIDNGYFLPMEFNRRCEERGIFEKVGKWSEENKHLQKTGYVLSYSCSSGDLYRGDKGSVEKLFHLIKTEMTAVLKDLPSEDELRIQHTE